MFRGLRRKGLLFDDATTVLQENQVFSVFYSSRITFLSILEGKVLDFGDKAKQAREKEGMS